MSQPVPTQSPYAPSSFDERPFNVLSIVGFVLSLVGISLVGVILGHIGLSQITKRGERGKGFAIAALVLGYLGILATIVIVILIVIATSIAASQGVITSS
jgi:peptidyl-prolyl cis-trans isomerase B (cyclophilin B)